MEPDETYAAATEIRDAIWQLTAAIRIGTMALCSTLVACSMNRQGEDAGQAGLDAWNEAVEKDKG